MLELKGICKRYVTQSFTQVALDSVSLSFRDNEFVAILGPSGSGKTTMLNVIGGLDHFDSGDLLIDGNLYPLTERPDNPAVWCAYQVHVPESGCGYVLAFRRPQCLEVQMNFPLSEIHPTAEYELEYFDGSLRRVRGSELSAGLPIVMNTPRSVTLIYYREVK